MALCGTPGCACGIISSSLQISGSGASGDPYVLESTGLSVVTSATRPGTPFLGQQIIETDTGRSYWWNGSAWKLMRDPANPRTNSFTPLSTTTSTTSTTMATWLALGNVTVPPWAKDVAVNTYINFVATTGGVLDVFGIRAGVGGVYGPERLMNAGSPSAPWGYFARIDNIPTGTQPLVLQARRFTVGTETARVTTDARIFTQLTYMEEDA